jgi:DNA polymerase-3 subunit alpha
LEFAVEADIHKRISEINRSGQKIELVPPDVNKSETRFYADPTTSKIYWSFTKIKYVGSTSVEVILKDKQENGSYYTLEEFIKRVPKKNVNKRTVTYMIMAGCFDELENIHRVEDRLELVHKHAKICKHAVDEIFKSPNAKFEYWWLMKQKEACGFGYMKYERILRKAGYTLAYFNEIQFMQPSSKNKSICFAGVIQFVNRKKTKRGDTFLELKCEVNSEMIFFTIWPEKYEEYSHLFNKCEGKIILASGTIDFNRYKNQNVLMSSDDSKIAMFEI